MERKRLEHLAIAVSLANLCWVRVWGELFAVQTEGAFFSKAANVDFVAAMLGVLLLASLFFAGRLLSRRAAIAGFAAVLLTLPHFAGPVLDPGVLGIYEAWTRGDRAGAAAAAISAVILLALIARFPGRALALSRGIVLFLTPFAALTFGRALWILAVVDPTQALASRAPPISTTLSTHSGPRAVIVMFDALGRDAIDESLPAFEALRAESIDFTNVERAAGRTRIAVPSITIGTKVTESRAAGAGDLALVIGERQTTWSAEPSLLRRERVVVAGWYHPYCRIFPELAACAWYPGRILASHGQDTALLETMRDQMQALVPYLGVKLRHLDVFTRLVGDAKIAVASDGAALVFLHLSVPHRPWIADGTHRGNVRLADSVLGELRAVMEARGTWEKTAVLVTSDHGWRRPSAGTKGDPRVPYFLKMPGAQTGIASDAKLDATITYSLATEILEGRITTPEDVLAWILPRSR